MAIVITDAKELCDIASAAGISVPADINDFKLDDHIHFVVFMSVQRGEELPYPSAASENAKMIAALSNERLTTITIDELIDLGFKFGPPTIASIH